MDISKIKVGKTVNYSTSRGQPSRGKVEAIRDTERGPWIKIADKSRDKPIEVRPAQISA